MNIVYAIAGLALSALVAFSFYKAGKFKATATKETLLGAGFGWVANIPFGLVRLIAWVELIGAVGIILAPLAAYFVPGFAWAQIWGVLAAAGLALTMAVAHIMHTVRGENKYTWKMTSKLFLFSAAAAVLQAVVILPVF